MPSVRLEENVCLNDSPQLSLPTFDPLRQADCRRNGGEDLSDPPDVPSHTQFGSSANTPVWPFRVRWAYPRRQAKCPRQNCTTHSHYLSIQEDR